MEKMVERAPGPEEDYLVDFAFDGNWLALTLHEGTRREAEKVAANLVEQFNPLEMMVSKAKLQQDLAELALRLHKDDPIFTGAVYTVGGEFLAEMVGRAYGEDEVQRPSPDEWRSHLLDWGDAKPKSTPDVTEIQLPVGHAVRVQAVLEEKRLFGLGRRLSETLRYAVWPKGQEEIILVDVDWLAMHRSDELTSLVDELMPTMHLVPVPPGADDGTGTEQEKP
ncbi:hypothetical protein ACFYYR_17530 [Streptomyces sp. NPDC001922]|uniref:hypothetical protein n=1 Tax=Streptomyces sp. NPDC001922 TaxID=3364624 RepID=UPI00369D2F08